MVAMKLLPFDAHNHIHLGPLPISHDPVSDGSIKGNDINTNCLVSSLSDYILDELNGKHLSGMAVMATHPRDFATILGLEDEIKQRQRTKDERDNQLASGDDEGSMRLVPCLGVHPWFLHELDSNNDWTLVPSCDGEGELVPKWTAELEELLEGKPQASVGEIGLDGFHFRSDGDTKELTTPMDKQVNAFVLQLRIATRLRRPVSLHCVRAMGKLIDALEEVASENYERFTARAKTGEWNHDADELLVLPPRMYFHAFGGKASTVSQLVKTIEKPRRIKLLHGSKIKFAKIRPPKVYFGFAPPVNFQSLKTPAVIRAVGIDRLVLETDREDIHSIGPDCEQSVEWTASILGVSPEELVRVTNANVRDLYYSR